VSYRQWNMMDEFQLVNDAKEALCFVSQNLDADMALLKSREGRAGLRRNFVLPDFHTTMRGYVQPLDVQEQPAAAAPGQQETQVRPRACVYQ
jgi:hypothetical protein